MDKIIYYYPVIATVIIFLIIFYVIARLISNKRRQNEFRMRYVEATKKRAYNLKNDYVHQIEEVGEKMRQYLELERQRIDNLLTASAKVMTKLEALLRRGEQIVLFLQEHQRKHETSNLAYLKPEKPRAASPQKTEQRSMLEDLHIEEIPQKKIMPRDQSTDGQFVYKQIYHLSDMGWSEEDIASTVGLPKNMVKLILSIRKEKK